MATTDTVKDRVTSLPVEIILIVASLLDTTDIIQLWRVSKKWNEIFRSEKLCKQALNAILEDTCPNSVADRSTAEQLSYHGHRLQRFYDFLPCGTTKMYLGEDHVIAPGAEYQPSMVYHDGKVVWLDKCGVNEDRPTRINVRSLQDGFILRKEPDAPAGLHKVGLSSRLVAVTAISTPPDDNSICFVWNLETGEECSFQLFSFAKSVPKIHDWLVVLRDSRNGENDRFQIWNYKQKISYVIDVHIPELKAGVHRRSYCFLKDNTIYHFGINHCHVLCMLEGRIRGCNQHDDDDAITIFYCTKSSITDGSLQSLQSKTIRTARPRRLTAVRELTQINRKGLLFDYMAVSEDRSSSVQSKSEPETNDDCPILLSLFQYDLSSDQIVIRQDRYTISDSFLKSLEEDDVTCFPWKDIVHIESRWSSKDVAFRAKLGSENKLRLQLVKNNDLGDDDFCGCLFSVDDMCIVGYEDNCIVTRWFDQLSYEKALGVCDMYDSE